MIERNVHEGFLDLFYHELQDENLENKNTLNLFVLKIKNNSFSYDELINELGNRLHYYALSRQQVDLLKKEDKLNDLIKTAKSKLREYSVNDGELGEILLYCLLESHLNAPKILTKLELKTANNDYVKGADGVHLLKLNERDYQLIFGESKLNTTLSNGISNAFTSIKKLLTENGKLNFELGLVNSELVKESFNESSYNSLRKIIIPSAREDQTNMDYSFGIFLGYNVELTDKDKQLSNSDFRTTIRERIKQTILSSIDSINNQIKKDEFIGYPFYVYVIPFSDLDIKRKEIIEQITN
ncbi:MAG: DUF1837 domain-containing protein [Bacteroidales bacterium]|jgi:hypothetical protein|nr:DUF1837 domain-containing protein [Bacteroidales bacterium]